MTVKRMDNVGIVVDEHEATARKPIPVLFIQGAGAGAYGGSVLLKYLAEAESVEPVAGAFVIAAPFWGADAFWSWDEGRLTPESARALARIPRLYLYHSRDDDIVPFSHLALLAAALPGAIVRELDGGGHQLGNDLDDVARDIASLSHDPAQATP